PLSKNGASKSAPNAKPGMTRIPMITYGPLANLYLSNSYKNKKNQSGNGIYAASVGSATPSSGDGRANDKDKNQTKTTAPTNHSYHKQFRKRNSDHPEYSEK